MLDVGYCETTCKLTFVTVKNNFSDSWKGVYPPPHPPCQHSDNGHLPVWQVEVSPILVIGQDLGQEL